MTEKWVVILNTGVNMTIECHVVEPDQFNNLCFYSPEGNLNTCFANGYWLNYARMEMISMTDKQHGYIVDFDKDLELIYVYCSSCKDAVELNYISVSKISEDFEDHMQHNHPEDYKS